MILVFKNKYTEFYWVQYDFVWFLFKRNFPKLNKTLTKVSSVFRPFKSKPYAGLKENLHACATLRVVFSSKGLHRRITTLVELMFLVSFGKNVFF